MGHSAEIDMVKYIQTTEPLLEKAAAYEVAICSYHEKVASVVEALCSNGLINSDDKEEVSENLYSYPEKMAELAINLAKKISPDSLGYLSKNDLSTENVDAITKFCLK